MNKKIIGIIIIIVLVLGIGAGVIYKIIEKDVTDRETFDFKTDTNGSNDTVSHDKHSFYGKIIEVHEGYFIVEPNEDEEERKSSDKFRIDLPNKSDAIYLKGTKVKITYEGMIEESYPAQIGTTSVEIMGVISMTIKEDTLTNSGMTLIMKNSGNQTYHYGPQYSIEKYENGEFITYEPKETLSWNAILYNIKVNEEKEEIIEWTYGYGKLENGKYRLVRYFTSEENLPYSLNVAEKFYVEFEIK